MASRGRNEWCACGSGLKAKRCCGVERGPSAEELEKAFLAEQKHRWAPMVLVASVEHELEELFSGMLDLPARHYRLQLTLPAVLPPECERLRAAIAADDQERFDEAIGPALVSVDVPSARARLVREVLALASADEIHSCLAAVVVVDLTRPGSSLFESSLIEALAVSAGAARTPSGLLVAAS